jgi:penicillin-insensitive murein endopeptidase
MRRVLGSLAILILLAAATAVGNDVARALESDTPSRSIGTPARGRLEHGKRLPTAGPNFRAYSRVAALLGRNSVHDRVRSVVVEAYAVLDSAAPGVTFVYGETGWPSGGRFRPHRTHQNGLSVDFMVPVRDTAGAAAALPTWPWLRFGYDVEFDSLGHAGRLRIDFAAVAAHLTALERAAPRHGLAVDRVIFAPEFAAALRQVPGGATLQARLPWMEGRPWVRHDEHYHIDFRLAPT